ncbi:TauD/TfdA family dioxygenase [Variovorax paradoxus]|uniref:TauD/TfdA dioxygenase family protein n=1 Tax=Variovorax paradoxus TaxID=34073 RepID=UPI001ABBFF8B
MTLNIQKLPSVLGAEVTGISLRTLTDPDTLAQLRAGMDEHAVLVFRDQPLENEEQLAFAERFDGTLHSKTSVAVLAKNRFGNEALTDISNVGADGQILPADHRLRMSTISNRLWHTDASFENPPGRYSMLSARVVPPVRADTEFADMRAAYDALDDATKAAIEGLQVFHSIAYSRQIMGFEFSEEEKQRLKGAVHPLARTLPRTGRRSLYLASHASHIVDMAVPEGRLILRDLSEHATQPQFIYRHEWRVHDFVIWDNRTTMHRARPFDDKKYRRELRRTTTLDLPLPATSTATVAA